MPIETTAQYYAVRARTALEMAKSAADPGVRKIHLELARRYAELAR